MAIKGQRAVRSWSADVEQLVRTRWKPGEQFTLSQVYEFVPELQRLRPDGSNIQNVATVQTRVRDALQQLRHQRRVVFLGEGTYRLL